MPSLRRERPLVHAPWTSAWWAGDPDLSALFGPPPSVDALAKVARAVDAHHSGTSPAAAWRDVLATPRPDLPDDTLLVLAGQQPVLGGGAALVAHKTATAIALADTISRAWNRSVVPVFLLATEDHDTGEVDHLDFINPSNGLLRRLRCAVHPRHEAFHRARWADGELRAALGEASGLEGAARSELLALACRDEVGSSFAGHVVALLEASFGTAGLAQLESHRLAPWEAPILSTALSEAESLKDLLGQGARRLADAGLAPSFDANDPRPLVMESRDHRRRRVEPADAGVGARLGRTPEDFSPHAALRPIVQASALPVIAQVCGPSELLYLAQARALHEEFDVPAPILVPRLEATAVDADLLGQIDRLDEILDESAGASPVEDELREVDAAAKRFVDALITQDAALRNRASRWLETTRKGARKLADAPGWRGRAGIQERLRPRGRPQDAVLAWLPDAWKHGDPAAWARHVVDLCLPLEPPVHVVHSYEPRPVQHAPPGDR